MEKKYVYLFKEGNADMRELLGGKGANLAEMTSMGLPVPQGFTITTEACTRYYDDGKTIGDEIEAQIYEALATSWSRSTGKKFGDENNPLLVSVRSGARASMPGMMDTILNLGLNDVSVKGLAKLTDNERFAYDAYRRFIQMFSDVVMEIKKSKFEDVLDEFKEQARREVRHATWTADDLKEVVERFKAHLQGREGRGLPAGSQGTADGGHQGCVPFLGQPPRDLLSPHERHPRQLGHRRERAVHGVRQHGRDLRYRRCLHPQPLHRRKEAVWRVPAECAGRGRCGRYPYPPAYRPAA